MLQGRFELVFVNTFTDFSGYAGEEIPLRSSNLIPTVCIIMIMLLSGFRTHGYKSLETLSGMLVSPALVF